MISLLLVVLLVQTGIHLLATIGSTTINNLLWEVYSRSPLPQPGNSPQTSAIKQDVVKLNREMNNTSAQDDFAKWAKLRRQHDKKKEEYDKLSREQQDFRSSFDRTAGILRWIGTTGIRYALQWWFGKQAMFWLPKGWVPYAAEWILSFPSAPLGSISINMWWIACASMIAMVSEAIISAWTIQSTSNKQSNTGQSRPMEPPVGSAGTTFEKKEL